MSPNTTIKTLKTLELSSPTGEPITVEVTASWVYETNPCDKEPAHYHGEDDGWTLEGVRVAVIND